jgi:hypothetical protein
MFISFLVGVSMFLLDVKTFAGINRPAIVARQKIGGFYHISIGVRGTQNHRDR